MRPDPAGTRSGTFKRAREVERTIVAFARKIWSAALRVMKSLSRDLRSGSGWDTFGTPVAMYMNTASDNSIGTFSKCVDSARGIMFAVEEKEEFGKFISFGGSYMYSAEASKAWR